MLLKGLQGPMNCTKYCLQLFDLEPMGFGMCNQTAFH